MLKPTPEQRFVQEQLENSYKHQELYTISIKLTIEQAAQNQGDADDKAEALNFYLSPIIEYLYQHFDIDLHYSEVTTKEIASLA